MANISDSVPLLQVRGLSMATPNGIRILDSVSFELEAGRILALVGESGSGKTMAARSVMRLTPPTILRTGGEVLFEGREVDALSKRDIRALRGAQIGMVFQEPMVSLNPAMTIGTQLLEAQLLHQKITAAEARARAIEMLGRVQITDPEGCMAAFPHEFSGGMRQRIMLASVMLLRPKLLIADEPTTALDTLSQREVLNLMVELTRTAGTAVLLITHNLGLVAKYADTVTVLERGRVVESGTVDEVLNHPREQYTKTLLAALPTRDETRTPRDGEPVVMQADNVSVSFEGRAGPFARARSKLAVNGVSLAVRKGETVAIVGGSGSGKTTLGRAMLGLVPISGGQVRYRDISMEAAGRAERRDYRLNCQLVFQDPHSSLNPRMKVREIVAEPLNHVPGLSRAERRQRCGDILREVGLEHLADRYPHALSGGQRQRVAIARAIIRNPAFVVADEPVSALDMTVQKQVLELFTNLQRRHGFACVFVSHDLGAVAQIADRIVVMKDGQIIEQGSTSEVLDNPKTDYTRALLDAAPTLAVGESVRKAEVI